MAPALYKGDVVNIFDLQAAARGLKNDPRFAVRLYLFKGASEGDVQFFFFYRFYKIMDCLQRKGFNSEFIA